MAVGFIIFLVNKKKLDRDNDLMNAEHVIFGHLRRALIECFEVRFKLEIVTSLYITEILLRYFIELQWNIIE